MLLNDNEVWAGSERSFDMVTKASDAMALHIAAGKYEQPEDGPSRLLNIDNGLATISIKGSLVNSDSFMNEMFGVTGYPEIRQALMDAAQDAEVKAILLDVDSGGGSVAGVEDTAKLIRLIHANVKPVTTYAETAASAAYWLGSSAGEVYAGKTSMVGSIGVIARHMQQVEAMKKEGVTVTTIRAGKEKALANPYEVLSDKGRASIQQMVDATYHVFAEHVGAMRGMTTDAVKATEAREFIGAGALDAGLIDGVTTYDEVVSKLRRQLIDSPRTSSDTRGKFAAVAGIQLEGEAGMKRALTEQDIATLAAGVSVTAEAAAVVAGEAVADDAEAGGVDAGVSEGGEAEATVAPAAQVVDVAKLEATVALLNSQLALSGDALLAAKLEAAKLADKLVEAQIAPMQAIVSASINNMQIAMGGSAMDMSAMTPAALVAEHARLVPQFQSKFKVGGVAAVGAQAAETQQPQVDPRHLARVNAARFNK